MSQGKDAGKKIVGRKRSIVTDTLGLLLAVLVTAASVQDSVAGTHLLGRVAAAHPTIRKAWVDGGLSLPATSTPAGMVRPIPAGATFAAAPA